MHTAPAPMHPSNTDRPATMTALQRRRYGGPEVIETVTLPCPKPAPGEVLIQVTASAVTTGDWRLRAAAFPGITALVGRAMFGIRRPRDPRIGSSFVGVVADIGADVQGFKPGQRVFGMGTRSHAQYITIDATASIAALPDALTDVQAAALPFGAVSALSFLRDVAQLKPGEHVLITGGSGGVGSMAIQIAKRLGATVTAMASGANQNRLLALGADHAVDYTTTPITALAGPFDVILDPVSAITAGQAFRRLTKQGRYVPLELSCGDIGAALSWPLITQARTKLAISTDHARDLTQVADWTAAGILTPMIDDVLPFAQAQAAHARVESRHANGTVILQGWDTPSTRKVGPCFRIR